MRRTSELAAVFGLTPTKFLRRLAHYNNLPGQTRSPKNPLIEGEMDLQVHHVVYITALDLRDYSDELLLVLCD